MEDKLTIVRGLPPQFRLQLARLYFEAFGSKIRLLLGTEKIILKLLTVSLNTNNGFYAFKGPRLVGFLGFETSSCSYSNLSYHNLRKVYNPFRAAFISLVWKITAYRGLREGQILIDTFAVLQSQRSQGIGSHLFENFSQFAAEKGYKQILLEVIDTNAGAIKLYQRLGFEPVSVRRYYFLSRFLGFSASITMSRTV